MANGEFLNLCSDCIESTDTSEMEYCGLTLSLAPHCDKCGKSGGKFGYYRDADKAKEIRRKTEMKTAIRNGVEYLDSDGIENVFATPAPWSAQYAGPYSERPIHYTVQLRGEKRKRRVYATPIGNVSVIYIKVGGRRIHCESAIDFAMHRIDKS